MKYLLWILLAMAVVTAYGCVRADLGQASKDWSEVGKSFAPNAQKGGTAPAPSNP